MLEINIKFMLYILLWVYSKRLCERGYIWRVIFAEMRAHVGLLR